MPKPASLIDGCLAQIAANLYALGQVGGSAPMCRQTKFLRLKIQLGTATIAL